MAQREAKLQGDLKVAKEALQKASESEKRAEQELKTASAAVKNAEAAVQKPVEAPQPAVVATAAPRVEAANDRGADRFDGIYVGRMCFPGEKNPDGSPHCFSQSVTVVHGTLSAVWPSRFSAEPARAKGTISPDGAVDVSLASWNPKNSAQLPGKMTGHWAKNAIIAAGAWDNGAQVTATWSRNP